MKNSLIDGMNLPFATLVLSELAGLWRSNQWSVCSIDPRMLVLPVLSEGIFVPDRGCLLKMQQAFPAVEV